MGGITKEGTKIAGEFYRQILNAEVHEVESPSVASAAKIIENSYRDINIAFVNEIALILDELGIDVKNALDAAATKPFGFERFSPGAGVGGHCIPVDPYFLIQQVNNSSNRSQFIKTARRINDSMPEYVVKKTIDNLIKSGLLPQDTTAILLGKAFKPGVCDTRNSPFYTIQSGLKEYDVQLETYDPYLPGESTVESPYCEVDVAVLITLHEEFRALNFNRLADNGVKLFVDGRNEFSPEKVRNSDIQYVGVGR